MAATMPRRPFSGVVLVAERLPVPADLGKGGRALWRATVKVYDLRPDEVPLLGEMCRTLDRLAAIRDALVTAPLIVAGSTGQDRAHPLLAEERAAQLVYAKLQAQLGLPDDEGQTNVTPAQRRAAKAANARWMREADYGPQAR